MNNKGADQTAHRAGWSGPLLFTNVEDRFSHVEAHLMLLLLCLCFTSNQQLDHMKTGHSFKVSSHRLVKRGIEPETPGLQGRRFIHYTTAAPPI